MARTRKPQQTRSQKTYEAIVTAGFIVMAQSGSNSFTTRRVADAAGVGVGSVYEYFQNKEAIIAAMHRRLSDELIAYLKPKIAHLLPLDLRSLVINLLEELRDFLQKDGGRYAAYVLQQNNKGFRQVLSRLNLLLNDLAVRYLIQHPEYAQVSGLPTIGYIAIHGGIAVIGQHLSEKNPRVSFDDLAEGLADMIEGMVNKRSNPTSTTI